MFFVKNTTACLVAIGIITLLSLASIFAYGIKLSPDFTGGSIVEMAFTKAQVDAGIVGEVQQKFMDAGVESVTTRLAGEADVIVRSASLSPEKQTEVTKLVAEELKGTIVRMNTVGPTIGAELYSKGIWAVIVVSFCILLYISFAFRPQGKLKEKKEIKGSQQALFDVSSWWYGIIAVATLAHDIVVPMGAFAFLGHMYGIEADTLFVTAILTILGFSVHDTIVIFDRIREKVRAMAGKSSNVPHFATLVGNAVSDTYGRSINTSLTVLISLITLYIFGPETTKLFALAMGLGVVAGTYSSIALAAPLLNLVHTKTVGR
jgi:preprotein translocase subunit SecF